MRYYNQKILRRLLIATGTNTNNISNTIAHKIGIVKISVNREIVLNCRPAKANNIDVGITPTTVVHINVESGILVSPASIFTIKNGINGIQRIIIKKSHPRCSII